MKNKILLIILMVGNGLFSQESLVYIPISIDTERITEKIKDATPSQAHFEDKDHDTKRYSIDIKVSDKKTEYKGNQIVHNIRLTEGEGWYKQRGYTNNPWPFSGRTYSPWVQVDCDNIRANATIKVSIDLSKDYELNSHVNYSSKVDNIDCGGMNLTGVLKAFGEHHFSGSLTKEINKELKKFDLKSKVSELWNQIQNPIVIDSSTYLQIKPYEILYKDINFGSGKLNTGIGLKFEAKTILDNTIEIEKVELPNLTKVGSLPASNIDLNLPLDISYKTIEAEGKKIFKGEKIKGNKNSKGKEKNYLKILDFEIDKSNLEGYEVKIGFKVRILRPFFKRKKGFIYMYAKLNYDEDAEFIYVEDYKIDSQTNSWLLNNSLEFLANTLLKGKLKSEMEYDIDQEVDKQVKAINERLDNKIKIAEGIELGGVLNEFEVKDIVAQENSLYIPVTVKGNINLEVISLTNLKL